MVETWTLAVGLWSLFSTVLSYTFFGANRQFFFKRALLHLFFFFLGIWTLEFFFFLGILVSEKCILPAGTCMSASCLSPVRRSSVRIKFLSLPLGYSISIQCPENACFRSQLCCPDILISGSWPVACTMCFNLGLTSFLDQHILSGTFKVSKDLGRI